MQQGKSYADLFNFRMLTDTMLGQVERNGLRGARLGEVMGGAR